jgi:hypothetical protein
MNVANSCGTSLSRLRASCRTTSKTSKLALRSSGSPNSSRSWAVSHAISGISPFAVPAGRQ